MSQYTIPKKYEYSMNSKKFVMTFDRLTEISIVPDRVTSIAFPSSVTSIADRVTSITIPPSSVTSIEELTFQDCSSLELQGLKWEYSINSTNFVMTFKNGYLRTDIAL